MGPGSDAYRIVLVVHVLSAVAGFGGIMFNAAYAAQGRVRGAREALVIAEANERVNSRWARRFVLATPLFGLALVAMSKGRWTFGQTWVWLSLAIAAIMASVLIAAVVPVERRQRALLGELSATAGGECGDCSGGCGGTGDKGPEPDPAALRAKAAELSALSARKASLEGVVNLGLIAVLALMVFTPGA